MEIAASRGVFFSLIAVLVPANHTTPRQQQKSQPDHPYLARLGYARKKHGHYEGRTRDLGVY